MQVSTRLNRTIYYHGDIRWALGKWVRGIAFSLILARNIEIDVDIRWTRSGMCSAIRVDYSVTHAGHLDWVDRRLRPRPLKVVRSGEDWREQLYSLQQTLRVGMLFTSKDGRKVCRSSRTSEAIRVTATLKLVARAILALVSATCVEAKRSDSRRSPRRFLLPLAKYM